MKKKTTNFLLYFIFLVTVIPTIIIYIEHAYVESVAYDKSVENNKNIKATKQFGEALLFYSIAIGYILTTLMIVFCPQYRIPYLVLLVGTIAIVILYYMRMYGIPIPFTEIVIVDFSSDWRDVITKICQQILVIPVSMLLIINKKSY